MSFSTSILCRLEVQSYRVSVIFFVGVKIQYLYGLINPDIVSNKIGSFFYYCFIYGLVSKSRYKFVMKDLNVGVRRKDNWHSGLLSKTCKVERS